MMEPGLITKFTRYFATFDSKNNSADVNFNDTGVDYVDLRSNDLWCLTYLMLIAFQFKFAACYSFDSTRKDSLIRFDSARFVRLYKAFCGKCAHDANLIHVVNSLLGVERFSQGTLTRHARTGEHSQSSVGQ